ncbi:MAG: amidohydrolase family protein [Pseudomonadota bacterium]
MAVDGPLVAAVGPHESVSARYREAERLRLDGTVLLPGLINAHQHGRGLSQIQLGFADLPLERWINARRRRGAPDGAAFTKLAAAQMIAHGVTATVHANYAYGTGDYEAEVRGQINAYVEAGLRVTFCVGAQDRGFVVYPPFTLDDLGPLPAPARRMAAGATSPYAPDAASLITLMDRLLADYEGHPLVTLCWGPAGPQWVSDDLWRAIGAHAMGRGIGIHLHCLESPTQAKVCRELYPEGTLRHLDRLGVLGPSTVLAHAVHVTAEDVLVAASTGVTVVHNPGSNLRLANGIAPVGALVAAGVPVALGTDNTALDDDEDLLGELKLMAALARTPPDPHWLDAGTLLAAATCHGARAMQHAGTLGRIAPGLAADLTAVALAPARGAYCDPDTGIAEAIVSRTKGTDVRFVMTAGRVLWRDGRHVDLDLAAIEQAAADVAKAERLSKNPDAQEATAALDAALGALYGNGP